MKRQVCTQGECLVKTGIALPQAKELPDARRKLGTDLSLAPSEGAWTCQHLDFGLLATEL